MDRLLSKGSKGADVKEMQGLHNYHGSSALPPLETDGIFGPKTLARVKEFQSKSGLAVDGLVGPNTWAALRKAPARWKERRCGTCTSANQGRAEEIRQKFLASMPKKSPRANRGAQPGLEGDELLDTLIGFKKLTVGQIATATTVYGSSIDFSKVLISDSSGLEGRAFTIALDLPLTPTIQIMNCGTFKPDKDTLIHELAHVWQSQHSNIPTLFMSNAAGSQAAAVAANTAAGLKDKSLKKHSRWPISYPYSAYAHKPGKSFSKYAAEQIAQQIENGESAIVSKVKSVPANDPDLDNVLSLSTVRWADLREPGVRN